MKMAYPIILEKGKKQVVVHIPDFDISTEGTNLADAIENARDAIGLVGIVMEDEGKTLPVPSEPENLELGSTQLVSLVDVDFLDYRRKQDQRSVKKNCTIPSWLNYEAEKAGINFSAILQSALKSALGINDPIR